MKKMSCMLSILTMLLCVAFSVQAEEAGKWSKAGEEIKEAAHAVGEATEDSSRKAWETTKEESAEAWDKTKHKSKEAWEAGKKKLHEATAPETVEPEASTPKAE